MIHWSLELLLGEGRDKDKVDAGCEGIPVSSSSSSSSDALSALSEVPDRSE